MDGAFPTTQIIDKTCNVDIDKCQGIMDKLGRQITSEENCGLDFRLGNPIVNQAYAAFIAYKPIYTASCLKSDSGSYCYVDAMTNTSSPSDSYPYYIPLGRNLPGGSRLTGID
ncbi:hypothetical protein Q9L58_001809 [Maublancomyces gigas]|uniref:DUF7729 domain-containing protein n=1 Tax=Discina gigas TaxID=1032678 RepID=A0ABR3GT51_9PEZI